MVKNKMQKVIIPFSMVIGFLIGFKTGERLKNFSAIYYWDRELTREEIETLYRAGKIVEDSLN